MAATDRYIATGGDDAGAGTALDPWKTINKLSNYLLPGYVGFVGGGNYDGQALTPANDGTLGSPVTYQNVSGQTPVLRRVSIAINLVSKNYITLDGIDVSGERWMGITDPKAVSFSTSNASSCRVKQWALLKNCTNIIIKNSRFEYCWGFGSLELDSSSYCKIQNMDIFTAGTVNTGSSSGVIADSVMFQGTSSYNILEDSLIRCGGHNLLSNKDRARYNIIRRNYFDNNWLNYYTSAELTGSNPTPVSGYRNISLIGDSATTSPTTQAGFTLLEDNYFAGSGTTNGGNAGGLGKLSGDGYIFRRNIVANMESEAFLSSYKSNSKWRRWNQVYHNTFYNQGGPIWNLVTGTDDVEFLYNAFQANLCYEYLKRPAGSWEKTVSYSKNSGAATPIAAGTIRNNIFIKTNGATEFEVPTGATTTATLSLADVEASGLYSTYVYGNIRTGTVSFATNPPTQEEHFLPAASCVQLNAATALTTTTAPGTSVTQVPVNHPYLFAWWLNTVDGIGDLITIGTAGNETRVTTVDYSTKTLTVSPAITFSIGDGVFQGTFSGAAPDIGALERGVSVVITCPDAATTTPFNTLLNNYDVVTAAGVTTTGGAVSLTAISLNAGYTGAGSAVVDTGTVDFTPTTGFSGAAVCTYTVTDGAGNSNTGTLTITVQAAATTGNTALLSHTFSSGTAEVGALEVGYTATIAGGNLLFDAVDEFANADIGVVDKTITLTDLAFTGGTGPDEERLRCHCLTFNSAFANGYYLRVTTDGSIYLRKSYAGDILIVSKSAVITTFPATLVLGVSVATVSTDVYDASFTLKVDGTPVSEFTLTDRFTLTNPDVPTTGIRLRADRLRTSGATITLGALSVSGTGGAAAAPTVYDALIADWNNTHEKKIAAVAYDVVVGNGTTKTCSEPEATVSYASAKSSSTATGITVSFSGPNVYVAATGSGRVDVEFAVVDGNGNSSALGTFQVTITNASPVVDTSPLTFKVPHNSTGYLVSKSLSGFVSDADYDVLTSTKNADPSIPTGATTYSVSSGSGGQASLLVTTPTLTANTAYTGGSLTVTDESGATTSLPIAIQVHACHIPDRDIDIELNTAKVFDIITDLGATTIAGKVVSTTAVSALYGGISYTPGGTTFTYTPVTDAQGYGVDQITVAITDNQSPVATDSATLSVDVSSDTPAVDTIFSNTLTNHYSYSSNLGDQTEDIASDYGITSYYGGETWEVSSNNANIIPTIDTSGVISFTVGVSAYNFVATLTIVVTSSYDSSITKTLTAYVVVSGVNGARPGGGSFVMPGSIGALFGMDI